MKHLVALRTVLLGCLVLTHLPGTVLFAQKPAAAAQGTGEWKVLRIGDHDYVSSKSIQDFYHFDDLRILNNAVWLISPKIILRATLKSRDMQINGVYFNLNYTVETVQGEPCFSRLDLSALIDPLLRPSGNVGGTLFDTVVIDPGHGGLDTGATNNIHQSEKEITLQIALALKADLERRGLKVVMTRSKDVPVSEQERMAMANRVPHSIFISLHYGCLNPTTTGIGTCMRAPRGTTDHPAPSLQEISRDLSLSCVIHSTVTKSLKGSLGDRGIAQAFLALLSGVNQPAVLLEPGVLTSANDANYATHKNFPADLAHAIGDAVANYRKSLEK